MIDALRPCLVALVLFCLAPPLHAQTTAFPSHVLDLDGTNACVVLPSGLVSNDVVTVEGWFKWRKFGNYSRLFDFYGEQLQFGIHNLETRAILEFERPERVAAGQIRGFLDVDAPGFLATNEWCHVAAVVRTNSTKLFFDGVLVATEAARKNWAPPSEPDRTNYLGRSALISQLRTGENPDFDGQMTEIRLWAGERTEAQIRETMFQPLMGKEPGLAGLWNFADPAHPGNDATTNAHHGVLSGNARVASALLPTPSQLPRPSILYGQVTDETGRPLPNTTIRFLNRETEIATAASDPNGNYTTAVSAGHASVDIEVIAGDLGTLKVGVVCPPGQRAEVNLTLSNAVSIAGKVTAFDGSLIEDAVIQIVRADAPATEGGKLATPGLVATTLTAATTNTSEAYRFVNLRPGDYKVMLHAPDAQLAWHGGEIVHVAPGKTVSADFQVAPFRKGRWKRYSTANGLPSTRVNNLQFMPDGILWLATQNGVSRFDGFTFTTLSKRDGCD
jgi:hypothetical protein